MYVSYRFQKIRGRRTLKKSCSEIFNIFTETMVLCSFRISFHTFFKGLKLLKDYITTNRVPVDPINHVKFTWLTCQYEWKPSFRHSPNLS